MLVVDICRYYEVCPAQLSPNLYKVFLMFIKYVELAGHEVTLGHVLSLFTPWKIRGKMIHACPLGSKGLVVKIDDRNNRLFFEKFFYVRTEYLVVYPTGFLEVWNFARMFSPQISSVVFFSSSLDFTLYVPMCFVVS